MLDDDGRKRKLNESRNQKRDNRNMVSGQNTQGYI